MTIRVPRFGKLLTWKVVHYGLTQAVAYNGREYQIERAGRETVRARFGHGGAGWFLHNAGRIGFGDTDGAWEWGYPLSSTVREARMLAELKLVCRAATLRIARGLPGCGKTTALQRWRDEDSEHRIVLGQDDWRAVLDCLPVGKQHEEAAITVILTAAVEALLRRGWDVGVDSTHIQPGILEHWQALAGRYGARWEILDLTSVPVEVCISRDLARRDAGGRYVGKAVIQEMASLYLARR